MKTQEMPYRQQIIMFGQSASGKTKKANELAELIGEGVVKISAKNIRVFGNPFAFSACNLNTKLIIIDDILYIKDFQQLRIFAYGEIVVNQQMKDPFTIRPDIIFILDSRITRDDLLRANLPPRFILMEFFK